MKRFSRRSAARDTASRPNRPPGAAVMGIGWPVFLKTTTFRLAVVNALLFALFSAGLLAYLYFNTVGFVRGQAAAQIGAEVKALETAYRTGGLARLNQSVLERASVPKDRRYFYLLLDREGQKISGDFSGMVPMETLPQSPSEPVLFDYDILTTEGEVVSRTAEGRVARLQDGGVLLVAYDQQEISQIMPLVTRAVITAAPIGLILSLIGGVVISRSASRRAEALAKTAAEVMAGDLTRRAPVYGSGDEFDRLSLRLNAMLERLEALVTATKQAGDALAHDLRHPLSRLRNSIETALRKPLSQAEAEETLGQSLEEIDHVLNTFNALLRLSRLEAGAGVRTAPTDFSALAHEIAELFGPACEVSEIQLNAKIAKGLNAEADRDLIAQALSNLMDNAMKYSSPGGDIAFEARRNREGDVELVIQDSGPGIPEAERERAVKRFVRIDESRSTPGSGLGLSLVKAIADRHGGELVLGDGDGPPDQPGLRAVLRLPKAA